MNKYYNFLIFISGAIAGLIALAEHNNFSWIKKSGFNIVKSVVVLFALWLGYWANEQKENDIAAQQRIKDSMDLVERVKLQEEYARELDSSITANSKKNINALAEWGLRLDSSNKIKRDTTIRNVVINYGSEPSISMCDIKKTKKTIDTLELDIYYCPKNYPIVINSTITTIGATGNNFYTVGVFDDLEEIKEEHANDLPYHYAFGLKLNPNSASTIIFFYVKISYTNRFNTKAFKYSKIFSYDVDKNIYGIPNVTILKNIKKYLKINE